MDGANILLSLCILFAGGLVIFQIYDAFRKRKAAFTLKERIYILLFAPLFFCMCLLAYMPDGFFVITANCWNDGPDRHFFGFCGMLSAGAMFLCGLVDFFTPRQGKANPGPPS